ncbi:MAG TPA: TonB-dependent receptor [Rhizomicrobium sp.]|jgi:iron complex outermembrane receptor protein|nr:TonB-dependent receptor [Rhizomicrobium sp.]
MKSHAIAAFGARLLLGAAVSSLMAGAAAAQTSTASPAAEAASTDQIETVTVTAERRAENAQKVPIAINAISGDALTSQGINNTQDLAAAVPGLSIETDVGNTKIFLRGVGTTGKAIENDVGLYVDGVYNPSQTASLLSLSNIDHVEVLKGPQGTLFGRNTLGGAVQIVTKTPSQDPSADISVGYGNYNTATLNFYGTTGVTENLATSLAVYYNRQSDGWGRDLTTGRELDTDNSLALSNKWVYTPDANTTATLSLFYAKDHNDVGQNWHFLPGAVGIDGVSTYKGFYNTLADGLSTLRTTQYGSTFRLEHDFGWAHAVSISAYQDSRDTNAIDQDATPLPIVEANPTPENSKVFSQELQLLSEDDSKLQWIAGLFYQDDKFYTPGFYIYEGPTQVKLVVNEPTKSYAAYGQASYEILPDTHLSVGLRYTADNKSADGQTFVDGTFAGALNQKEDFSKVTYHVSLDHQFTPDVMGYISYDTGYKSGQFNIVSYTDPAVKPEGLKAYQGGVKTEFWDNRVRLNAAAFYYDWSNIQITQTVTGGVKLLNAAAARMYGLDADVDALITDNFKIQGALSWLNGRYTDFPNAPSYVPNVDGSGMPIGGNVLVTIPNAKGYTTVESPSFTGYLAGNYTIPLSSGTIDLNANVSYNSGFYWDPDNRIKQPAYALVGAYVMWAPNEANWDVRVWGNNILDKKYYAFEDAFSLGDIGAPAAPATYGVTLEMHF